MLETKITKSIVLVGLMGSGKSSIGWRLAKYYNLPFIDTDVEIEKKAHCSISDLFYYAGEDYFRRTERNLLEELSYHPPCIIAAGGGAFINEETRALIKKHFISIWIKAEYKVLLERLGRYTTHRPLIEKNKEEVLQELIKIRYPIYEQTDITVCSDNRTHAQTIKLIVSKLEQYFYE